MDKPKLDGQEIVSKQAMIFEAAFEQFAEKGFSATRLDDVAAGAGVAKGTLYLYFDSKEDLFKKVVEQTLIPNIGPLEEKLDGYDGPMFSLLEEVFNHFGKMITTTRIGVFPKIILAEANNFPDLAAFYCENVVLRMQKFFTRVIELGISRGEFRKVDATASARIIMAPFLMLALLSQTPVIAKGLGLDPEDHIRAARDILGFGLRK